MIDANGVAIHYALQGPVDAPVVTLAHSLAADLTMWDPTLPALTDGYRVLRYDVRGHGGSAATPGPYSMDLLAADALALLGALGIARTHWVGLSLGGMIGQALALRAPAAVASLALCDTASVTPPELRPAWDARIAMIEGGGAGAASPGEVIARWFTPGFVAARPDVLARTLAMIARTTPRGFAGAAAAIRDLDLTARLREIRVPTLLIVGEQDEATPVDASRLIQDHIEDAELIIIKSAAHLSNIEQPEAFNQALLGFLDRIR
ncbi:MAG TPA: 3-oxoadipate enol-lactonase [Methylomirabilota bacterium]|nr:3-oxoadipate enol-lactonase [Methylomirabilota bacterium]